MGTIMNWAEPFAADWLEWMVAMTWQVALVGVAALAVTLLARKASPRFRYLVWGLVFVKLCIPPTFTLATGIGGLLPTAETRTVENPIEPTAEALVAGPAAPEGRQPDAPADPLDTSVATISKTEHPPLMEDGPHAAVAAVEAERPRHPRSASNLPWRAGLLCGWLLGAAGMAFVLARQYRRMAWQLTLGREVADPRVIAAVEQARRAVGGVKPLRLISVPGIDSPLVFGLFRPRMALPEGLLGDLSDEQLRAVMLHECAHIKRRDLPANWVQAVLQTLYWFHPFVWLAGLGMRRERELIADDIALAHMPKQADAYGESLLMIVRHSSRGRIPAPGLMGIVEGKRGLARRLRRAVDGRRKLSLRLGWLPLSLVVALGLVLLPQARSQVQTPAEDTKEEAEEAIYAPEDAVVMNPNMPWGSSGWAGSRDTMYSWREETEYGTQVFHVDRPGKRRVWTHYFSAPIPVDRYSVLYIVYRAKGLADANSYMLWVDDGEGPNGGGRRLVNSGDLVDDGEVHELRRDLAEMNFKGNIVGMALGVMCDPSEESASLEIIDFWFERGPNVDALRPIPLGDPIAVKVVDHLGQPVAGATVTIDPERRNFGESATTGEDGLAAPRPHGTEAAHSILVSKPGMTSLLLRDASERPDRPILFKLHPTRQYTGKVVDEDGQPIKDVRVELWLTLPDRLGRNDPRPTQYHPFAFTDKEGAWRADPIDATATVALRLRHLDYLSDQWGDHHSKTDMDTLRAGEQVSVMSEGVVVSGVVLDPQGEPIPGAYVAQGTDQFPTNAPPTTQTDAEGRFEFQQTPEGNLYLTVRRRGYSPAETLVVARSGMDPVEVTLGEPHTIRFKVTDPGGAPIPGVRIVADTWRDLRTLDWGASTDGEGRAEWESAPPDEVLYDLYKRGLMSIRRKAMTPREEEYVIVMHPPLTISGSVVDAKTGEPIPVFDVVKGAGWEEGQRTYWNRREVAKGHEGRYQVRFDFPRDKHYVRVEAAGYMPMASRGFDSDEGKQIFDFRLEKAENIAGRVLDSEGRPVGGASVGLTAEGSSIFITDAGFQRGREIPSTVTGADGKFEFTPREGGFLIAAVCDAGWAVAKSSELGDSLEMRLRPWAKVEGRYMIGTKPGVNQEMQVNSRYPAEEGNGMLEFWARNVTTDADGRFEVARVLPGEVSVSTVLRLGESRTSGRSVRVSVEPGQRAEVMLGGTGRPVIGKVVPPEDAPEEVSKHLDTATAYLRTFVEYPEIPYPGDWPTMSAEQRARWQREWQDSEERRALIKAHRELAKGQKSYSFSVRPDGSFRAEDIPAGDYDLSIGVQDQPSRIERRAVIVARTNKRFTVPEMPNGRSDEPLDLGELELRLTEPAAPGDTRLQPF